MAAIGIDQSQVRQARHGDWSSLALRIFALLSSLRTIIVSLRDYEVPPSVLANGALYHQLAVPDREKILIISVRVDPLFFEASHDLIKLYLDLEALLLTFAGSLLALSLIDQTVASLIQFEREHSDQR